MDSLFRKETAGDTTDDITKIMLIILRTVIQTTIKMDRESPLVVSAWITFVFIPLNFYVFSNIWKYFSKGNLASVMISIFRQMTSCHFTIYINHFNTRSDLLDFLMEILLVFKDLISRPVYPVDWCEMILLQNRYFMFLFLVNGNFIIFHLFYSICGCFFRVILRSLRFFALTIRDHFSSNFEHQVWNNFFHCAVAFLTQPALQLETFSPNKRSRIASEYKDMRITAGFEIRNMWFNLGTDSC